MQPPPSLPPRPATSQVSSAPAAAFALRSALVNPYSQAYSNHYAQAYMRQFNQTPLFQNVEGYSISSTYNPNTYTVNNTLQPKAGPSSVKSSQNNGGIRFESFAFANSSWYQSGNNRCTFKGCAFTGSANSVQTHMMDRHLIYPPGWNTNKKSDWDTDPSLRGKPIPIQGTNVVLNTPDAIDAWLKERKNRWPSSTLIAEKKRKFEEASARGELSVESLGLFSKKKQRIQGPSQDNYRTKHPRSGRGRERGVSDSGWGGRDVNGRNKMRTTISAHPRDRDAMSEQRPEVAEDRHDSSSSESDSEPEVVSSKLPPALPPASKQEVNQTIFNPAQRTSTVLKKPLRQPKRQPHNSFAPKANLLRNLLLPEIRMTVSNLSQAIRFLVDNNFLDGVELEPGESHSQQLIQVVSLDPEPSALAMFDSGGQIMSRSPQNLAQPEKKES
ncbi:hypothetical protein D9757_002847 [Collybiopsis confluens]|uniref:FMR1-interacting protein 1 conserved domain-containing protein n=1 Tax=Collybiopsis confluens TaxID=2823264 RepID=A0A8H5HVF6_9AGAR|nr:hypothetical protein D9757_002847 [Collybiopsis confluens]